MFVLLHHEQQGLTLADVRKRKFIVRGVCVCVCVCVFRLWWNWDGRLIDSQEAGGPGLGTLRYYRGSRLISHECSDGPLAGPVWSASV